MYFKKHYNTKFSTREKLIAQNTSKVKTQIDSKGDIEGKDSQIKSFSTMSSSF